MTVLKVVTAGIRLVLKILSLHIAQPSTDIAMVLIIKILDPPTNEYKLLRKPLPLKSTSLCHKIFINKSSVMNRFPPDSGRWIFGITIFVTSRVIPDFRFLGGIKTLGINWSAVGSDKFSDGFR